MLIPNNQNHGFVKKRAVDLWLRQRISSIKQYRFTRPDDIILLFVTWIKLRDTFDKSKSDKDIVFDLDGHQLLELRLLNKE